MKQKFKSVYFTDHPAESRTQRHIRLAFGPNDNSLYENVQHLSSEEIRQLLGVETYAELTAYARDNALSINRASISLMHRALESRPTYTVSRELSTALSDPLIATYRGGNGDGLHGWFPWLEGFSPKFVKATLDAYAPTAGRVLDPFAGTGATPLTMASIGAVGLYCELNPLLQFVTEAKYKVLQLPFKRRAELAEKITELAFSVRLQLSRTRPDQQLRRSYARAFAGSRFFDEETLDDVLRLRTFADEVSTSFPLAGHIFTVAVLASLVPSSLMVRRGDLRYKTQAELSHDKLAIRHTVSQRLEDMAVQIPNAAQAFGSAVLVCENAQSLAFLPNLNVECVITSPPYLNGTNYFRNTKLELWFLRALRTPGDLSVWRHRSLTAGINDVTLAKCDKGYPGEVEGLVHSIRKVAYDPRIPLMIGSYFRELDQIFSALSSHLVPGAICVVDIGDSRYSGVHVETDRLLASIANRHRFSEISCRTLRMRKSRDGALLRQSLLVLQYRGNESGYGSQCGVGTTAFAAPWIEFKARLPHQLTPFSKRNWGHPLHSLCSYQGKMKPSIAHFLVGTFVPRNGKMLDPFAGTGTIPFEACLQGMQAFGFEINPAAFAISTAKTGRPRAAVVWAVVDALRNYLRTEEITQQEIDAANQVDFNRCLGEFYHQDTLREILLARRFFRGQQGATREVNLVLASLLHILHGNRPYALSRRSHPVTPFAPTGSFEYRPLIERLSAKVERSLNVDYPAEFQDGRIFLQDALSWWPNEASDLDAIITSPPFFDSTRFYLANWIRLWFCGWERHDFDTQPLRFLELKQKQSMRAYEPLFRQARERLNRGGVVVLHVGKSTKCNMAEELREVGKPWFRLLDVFEESVSHCESHGITDKGEVFAHQYLVLG